MYRLNRTRLNPPLTQPLPSGSGHSTYDRPAPRPDHPGWMPARLDRNSHEARSRVAGFILSHYWKKPIEIEGEADDNAQ